MSLNLYYHPVSQPSKAILITLLIGKVEFTPHVIDILKGEQKSPEFTLINPAQQVPAITDGDYSLFESHAILRYLVSTRESLKHLYPNDAKNRGLVDAYLDWHHTGTRKVTLFARDFFFQVLFAGKEAPTNREERIANLEVKLEFFERHFLGGDKRYNFIQNQPTLTIADISAVSELTTAQFFGYDFSKFPNIQRYLLEMFAIPEVRVAHKEHFAFLNKVAPNQSEFNLKLIG